MKPLPLLLTLFIPSLFAEAANPPNILFIIVDDQSPFDFKAYNPYSQLDAPVLGKLAADGMVFDGAYHMGSMFGAVCTASRHMVMTGRTLWNIPQRVSRKKGQTPTPEQAAALKAAADYSQNAAMQSLPAVFNRAGYITMRTCKKGNSYEGANAQFTIRHDATKRGGSEESGSAWHAEQVLNFLGERETSAKAGEAQKPFLIYYGFSHPHDTRDGTSELLDKYGVTNHRDKNILPPANPQAPHLPGNWLPEHPFHHGHPGLRDEVSVSGVWERRDELTIRNEIGRQFACSENIDIQIGRVLGKLEAMGELNNTYVFYTADHGMAIGRHGLQGKQNLYEHTWRVPFFAKGPGIKPGSRVQGNIYLLDTLATLCDIAGICAPETNEGISFKPVLMGQKETTRDTLYGAYCGGTKPGIRSVRKGDWKLVKFDVMDGQVRETQLFNLKDNPHEFLPEHKKTGYQQTNLAPDPKHAAKLKEMEALLLAEMQRLGDPYRLWNQSQD